MKIYWFKFFSYALAWSSEINLCQKIIYNSKFWSSKLFFLSRLIFYFRRNWLIFSFSDFTQLWPKNTFEIKNASWPDLLPFHERKMSINWALQIIRVKSVLFWNFSLYNLLTFRSRKKLSINRDSSIKRDAIKGVKSVHMYIISSDKDKIALIGWKSNERALQSSIKAVWLLNYEARLEMTRLTFLSSYFINIKYNNVYYMKSVLFNF